MRIIRSLQPGEEEACLDLWDQAFSDTPRAYFEKYFHDPQWRRDDTVVAVEGNALVSCVHFVRRTVETPDGLRRFAGVANVGTRPDFRGKGYNRACLEESLRRMEADASLDFSLLGTGISDYYARFDYKIWPLALLKGERLGRQSGSEASAGETRPAVETDLPQIGNIYAAYNVGRPIAVVRDPAYWQNWIGWRPDDTVVALRPEGSVCGYVTRGSGPSGSVLITEIAAMDDATIPALLRAACLRVESARARLVHLNICPDPALRAAADRLLEKAQPVTYTGWMIRALHDKPLPPPDNACFYSADGF